MRNVKDDRKGSIAFATVISLVPLIGFLALGAEAGSWYVTKQHAQTAADAAAYSGGLQLACTIANLSSCDSTTYDTRGKQVAAQNAFCNTGDTSYAGSRCIASLPSGTSQAVTMASLTSWNGTSGNFIQATVSQQQPTYMANLFGLSNINIAATAVASVTSLAAPPCALALVDPITFQGSPTLSSSNCGIASNNKSADAIGFKGNNGIQVNAPSYTVGGCSQTGGSQCTNVQTYQQAIPDPLSPLKTAMTNLKTSDFAKACTGGVKSYEAGGSCYNSGNVPLNGALSGTYYFYGGKVSINGGATITGTATLVLFGSGSSAATLMISGNPTIQLKAMKSPTGPASLSSVLSYMKDLLIYDGEKSTSVKISGSATSYFDGTIYVPQSPVIYAGNSDSSAPAGCYQVIAYSITFSGNTKLDNSTCKSDGAATPQVQTVRLVTQ